MSKSTLCRSSVSRSLRPVMITFCTISPLYFHLPGACNVDGWLTLRHALFLHLSAHMYVQDISCTPNIIRHELPCGSMLMASVVTANIYYYNRNLDFHIRNT